MQNSLLLSDDLKKLFNCYELYKLFQNRVLRYYFIYKSNV